MTAFPIEPPRGLIMPAALQHVSLIMAGVAFSAFVIFALWQFVVRREPLPLFCAIGGLGTVILEPLCDVIGLIYHPEIGQISAFEGFGRHIPWHVVLLLVSYYAFFAWILVGPVRTRMTRAGFWKLFMGLTVFSMVLEIGPVQQGLWVYYGKQPFTVAGMPLWWFPTNAVSALAGGTLAALGISGRNGWRRSAIVLLIPLGVAGSQIGCALPTYIAINAGWTGAALAVAGLLTVVYGLMLMNVAAHQLFPKSFVASPAEKST